MDKYTILIVITVFLIIIVLNQMLGIFKYENSHDLSHDMIEGLTLKTDCDEARRGCIIANSQKDGTLYRVGYHECMLNSPIC